MFKSLFVNAAALRCSLKTDKYKVISCKVNTQTLSVAFYHSCCCKSYTAIKRTQIPIAMCDEPVFKKVTQSDSSLSKSDHFGLLKGMFVD